jgi:hypothetical protein
MKIFVLCDEGGNVQSVAIPNPALAGNLSLEAPAGGRVHILDIDSRAMTREDLLDPKSEEERRKVYDTLRAMIAGPAAPRPGHGRRSRRGSHRRSAG